MFFVKRSSFSYAAFWRQGFSEMNCIKFTKCRWLYAPGKHQFSNGERGLKAKVNMATPFLFQPNTVDLPDPQCINLWLLLEVSLRLWQKREREEKHWSVKGYYIEIITNSFYPFMKMSKTWRRRKLRMVGVKGPKRQIPETPFMD